MLVDDVELAPPELVDELAPCVLVDVEVEFCAPMPVELDTLDPGTLPPCPAHFTARPAASSQQTLVLEVSSLIPATSAQDGASTKRSARCTFDFIVFTIAPRRKRRHP